MGLGKNMTGPNNTSNTQATARGSWGEKNKEKNQSIQAKFIADRLFRNRRNSKQQQKSYQWWE